MLGTIIYLVVGVILVISLAFLGLFGWFFVNVVRGIQRDQAVVKPFKNLRFNGK
jgi:hypothetical protein